MSDQLTRADVFARIAQIDENKDDDEVAHGDEDLLHSDVLRTIARGEISAAEMAELAALALKTLDIKFARWCA